MTDADEGWTDSPRRLFRHRVMLEMARGESDCVDIAATLESGPAEVRAVFVELVASELAGHSTLRMGDTEPEDAYLTAAGKTQVRRWEEARTPARMKRACMAALLSWLDAKDGQQISGTDAIAGNVRGHFYGMPFSDDTVGQAIHELLKLGLAEGISTNGAVVVRPRITSMGHMVHAQFGGDVTAWMASSSSGGGGGDTFHISNSTGVVVANRSPNAQQSVHVSTDAREQLVNVAAALEQMLDALGLGPADVARAYGLVGQLREAAVVVDTEPGKVKALLDTVKAVAVNGTGSAAGTALVALVEGRRGIVKTWCATNVGGAMCR